MAQKFGDCWIIDGIFFYSSKFRPKNLPNGANDRDFIS